MLAAVAAGLVGLLVAAGSATAASTTLNFGDQLVGSTSVTFTETINISAGQTYWGENFNGLEDDTDFTLMDSCVGAVGPATCTYGFTFSPTSVGSGALEVAAATYPTGGEPQPINNLPEITAEGVGVSQIPLGTITTNPTSGSDGSTIGVASQTPCPLGVSSLGHHADALLAQRECRQHSHRVVDRRFRWLVRQLERPSRDCERVVLRRSAMHQRR